MRTMNAPNVPAAALAAVIALAVLAVGPRDRPNPSGQAGRAAGSSPSEGLRRPARADIGFLRAEIPFVEFVPAVDEAQVRVLVTPQGRPGGGNASPSSSPAREFQGETNTLTYPPPGRKAGGRQARSGRHGQDRPAALRREDPGRQGPLGPVPGPGQSDLRRRQVGLLGLQPQRQHLPHGRDAVQGQHVLRLLLGQPGHARAQDPDVRLRQPGKNVVRPGRRRSTKARPTAMVSPASSSRACRSTGRPAPSSASSPRPTRT